MRKKIQLILSMCFALFVFMTINLPSIKLFYSSSIWNILALLGLLVIGVFRKIIIKEKMILLKGIQIKYITFFLLLWCMMLYVSFLYAPKSLSLSDNIQYISVILFSLSIVLFLKKIDMNFLVLYQTSWGIILSLLETTVGIDKNTSLGQNYLTSGVAIAVSIVTFFGYVYASNRSIKIKVLSFPIFLILFIGVTSLRGRTPILLAIIVPFMVLILNTLFETKVKRKILMLLSIVVVAVVSIIVLTYVLPESTINRIFRVFSSLEEEPRYELYKSSLDLIKKNPFGIGLKGTLDYGIMYPHNIFLEFFLVGGYFMIFPLLFLGAFIVNIIRKAFVYKGFSIVWFSLFTYFFLTWNISYDLSSSYLLFTSLTLLVTSTTLNDQFKVEKI